jgi:hypothetical protein
MTALHFAAAKGYDTVVKQLLDAGANMDLVTTVSLVLFFSRFVISGYHRSSERGIGTNFALP